MLMGDDDLNELKFARIGLPEPNQRAAKPDRGTHLEESAGLALCANMSETTLNFFKVEGTESLHDRIYPEKD
jgi:hypothetical protein